MKKLLSLLSISIFILSFILFGVSPKLLHAEPLIYGVVGGIYEHEGEGWDIEVEGEYAYVAYWGGSFQIIDISDPTDPYIAGFVTISATGGLPLAVDVVGDYAYVLASGGFPGPENEYFTIIDISSKTNPTVVAGSQLEIHGASNIEVSGDYAYIANGLREDVDNGLVIVDISTPSSPVVISTEITPGDAIDVCVYGDYAYIADCFSGLQIIDITDKNDPVLLEGERSSFDTPALARDIEISADGNFVFIADAEGTPGIPEPATGDSGLIIIDVSDKNDIHLEGSYNTPGSCNDVSLIGDYAYIAASRVEGEISGFIALNVTDKQNPLLVGYADTGADTLDVSGKFTSGKGIAFKADGSKFYVVGSAIDTVEQYRL